MSEKAIKKLNRRTFTAEFKASAVKLKRDQGLTYAEAGRRLDVLPRLIKDWEAALDAGQLAPGKAKRRITVEQQQISELRSRVSRLEMENAILKKAAAYFAKESL